MEGKTESEIGETRAQNWGESCAQF